VTREPARATVQGLFHSSVFAVFPILALISGTAGTYPLRLDVALRPIGVGLILNAVLFVALRPVVASPTQRGTLLTVAYIALHMHGATSTWNQGMILRLASAPLLAVVHVLAAAALVAFVLRSGPRSLRARLLTAAAAMLLATNAVQFAIARQQIGADTWRAAVEDIARGGRFVVPADAARPDIVHVVLDGLGSPAVLRDYYGLDTIRWTAPLEAQGFSVADAAQSNYIHTYSSMASLLSATYLDPLEAPLGDRPTRFPLHAVIEGSGVIRSLRDAGYRFTLIGSPYSATDSHPLAATCDCRVPPMAEMESAFLRSSVLRTVDLPWLTYHPHRRRVLEQLAALERLPVSGPPRYVLAHVISPHPPFAFDDQGRLPAGPHAIFGWLDGNEFPGTRAQYREGYRAQATFMLDQVAAIAAELRQRPRRTVVIVSGDHGPGLHLDHDDAMKSDLRERFGAFFAFVVPGRAVPVSDEFSLVNTYRLVAREVFGAPLELLPSRQYFTTFEEPYRFARVDGASVARREE